MQESCSHSKIWYKFSRNNVRNKNIQTNPFSLLTIPFPVSAMATTRWWFSIKDASRRIWGVWSSLESKSSSLTRMVRTHLPSGLANFRFRTARRSQLRLSHAGRRVEEEGSKCRMPLCQTSNSYMGPEAGIRGVFLMAPSILSFEDIDPLVDWLSSLKISWPIS